MNQLREQLQEETARRPEGIFRTNQGDLLVRKVGTRNVDAYNLHWGKGVKMTLQEFKEAAL